MITMTTVTPPRRSCAPSWLFLLISSALLTLTVGSSPSKAAAAAAGGMILRVRLPDGTMERIQVPPGQEDLLTIQQVLSKVTDNAQDGVSIRLGSSTVPIPDDAATLAELGLKHGSLLTLVSSTPKKPSDSESAITKTMKTKRIDRWDPFPEIAKDYETAMRKTKTRRSTGSGMSYADLAQLQSSLHLVEPQPEGPLKRVYMCHKSAERFQANCFSKKTQAHHNRVGLLLGTVSRERLDPKPKARTSLSSTTHDQQYCDVVKVHALWEPPQQKRHHYDTDALLHVPPLISQHARRVADWLGLRPVGWIFSHDDDRAKEADSLPVYASDIHEGAMLQIHNMKSTNRQDGSRFVTLAMDARSGATECFQLSDVCVQMVAEEMILTTSDNDDDDDKGKGKKDGRYGTTRHSILVDGKETRQLDSVLCLVNTAMLSHEGSFAGNIGSGNVVKKNGSLTNKARKAVLKAIEESAAATDTKDAPLLQVLCDFTILLALDEVLDDKDSERLCRTVQKWARGQKQGTELASDLKLRLQAILQQ